MADASSGEEQLRSQAGLVTGMGPLMECVPNFAEGRDVETLRAILAAMHLPGVLLLDYTPLPAQNRTMVTIAGPPDAVCEAAVLAAGIAAERIDLTRAGAGQASHHLRIGALDVLPLVPLRGITLPQCAALAREAALALWSRYGLPSYLYAAAASRPDRVALEEVRRGQFEGLRDAALADAGRRPDVGGPGLHPTAGATAVGARRVLIEYSLPVLGLTAHIALAAARAAARELRSERLRAQAMLVDGAAEVHFQLLEPEQLGPGTVHAAAGDAVRRHGATLGPGCITGLLPAASWEPASTWAAELRGFDPGRQIREQCLAHPLPWPSTAL